MMSSQLGRAILAGTTSSPDQMSASPEPDATYAGIDDLMNEIAAELGMGEESVRRPGQVDSAG